MQKTDFKKTSGIQMVANLIFALYVACLILGIILIIFHNFTFLIAFIGFLVLYFISWIFGIISAKKLIKIPFDQHEKEIAKKAYQYSFWGFFPLPFVILMQSLRTSMWNSYVSSRIKHLSKESDIVRTNLELLEELKLDGYISNYQYEKQKPRYEEQLKRVLDAEVESIKNQTKIEDHKKNKTKQELEDEKWQ